MQSGMGVHTANRWETSPRLVIGRVYRQILAIQATTGVHVYNIVRFHVNFLMDSLPPYHTRLYLTR